MSEAAKEGPAATGHFTAIDHAGGTCVPWQHAEANIVLLLLQLVPKVLELVDRLLLALISLYPALLCHGRGGLTWIPGRFKGFFFGEAICSFKELGNGAFAFQIQLFLRTRYLQQGSRGVVLGL